MTRIIVGTRDSHQDQEANAAAVVRAGQERTKMLTAIHAGDHDRAAEHSERAEAATQECYDRAMDRAKNLEKIGDPRGELARANAQMLAHGQRRDPRYRR